QIVWSRLVRCLLLDPISRQLWELYIECAGQAANDFVLGRWEIAPVGVEAIGPKMRAALGVGKLHVHARPITGPADAAFEDIADAEFTAELFNVYRSALVGKGSAAGDNKAACDPREIGGQIVGDPVDETFQIRLVREVGK